MGNSFSKIGLFIHRIFHLPDRFNSQEDGFFYLQAFMISSQAAARSAILGKRMSAPAPNSTLSGKGPVLTAIVKMPAYLKGSDNVLESSVAELKKLIYRL